MGKPDSDADSPMLPDENNPLSSNRAEAGSGASDNNQNLLELFPPKVEFQLISSPVDLNKGLTLAFDAEGQEIFNILFTYTIRYKPTFGPGGIPTELRTKTAFDTFMKTWAAQFANDSKTKEMLEQTTKQFIFKIDSSLLLARPVAVPLDFYKTRPSYARQIGKYYAIDMSARNSGQTSLKATLDGQAINIPIKINRYSSSLVATGKSRYQATNSCAKCHGSINTAAGAGAFLKHSADFAATMTDGELLNIIKLSTYPDGQVLLNGQHAFNPGSATLDFALIAYLRSLPTTFEKLPATE
jgi:mono/diheme cytochrome c family protein